MRIKMHFCTAKISLAADLRNVVDRDAYSPISWPEVEVLRVVHGETAITEIKPFVSVQQSEKDEKTRLRLIYGDVVEEVFPGRNPRMEMDAPGAKLPEPTPLWRNPLDKEPDGYDRPPETRAALSAADRRAAFTQPK